MICESQTPPGYWLPTVNVKSFTNITSKKKKYTFYEIYTIVFFINMLSIVVNSPKANISLPSASEIIKFCDSFLD